MQSLNITENECIILPTLYRCLPGIAQVLLQSQRTPILRSSWRSSSSCGFRMVNRRQDVKLARGRSVGNRQSLGAVLAELKHRLSEIYDLNAAKAVLT
jgi:hypothetical protein